MKLAGWSNVHQDGTINVAELQLAIEERKRSTRESTSPSLCVPWSSDVGAEVWVWDSTSSFVL